MSHERRILPTAEGTASYCTGCDWFHFTDSTFHMHAIDVLENHAQAWHNHTQDLEPFEMTTRQAGKAVADE